MADYQAQRGGLLRELAPFPRRSHALHLSVPVRQPAVVSAVSAHARWVRFAKHRQQILIALQDLLHRERGVGLKAVLVMHLGGVCDITPCCRGSVLANRPLCSHP